MESVESRAKEALEAYLKCNETVKSVYYKKICDHDCDNCNLNYAQGTYGDHKEAVKTAIQALEKQIPMKPRKTDSYRGVLKRVYVYVCPTCGNACLEKYMNERQNTMFCWNCGQKLDWAEESEG